MNRTRRAILCLLAVLPIGITVGAAHADNPPAGGQVKDDQPVQPAPWRWACTHPQVWVTGLLFVDGGRNCFPEDIIKNQPQPPASDPTESGATG